MSDAAHDRTVASGLPAGLRDDPSAQEAEAQGSSHHDRTVAEAVPAGLRDDTSDPADELEPGAHHHDRTVAEAIPPGLREDAPGPEEGSPRPDRTASGERRTEPGEEEPTLARTVIQLGASVAPREHISMLDSGPRGLPAAARDASAHRALRRTEESVPGHHAKTVAREVPAGFRGEEELTRRAPPGLRALAELGAAPRADPLLGTKVGEYLIEEQIGSGAVGIVYRARHPEIARNVAIKVLRTEVASDPVQVKRLLTEARAVNAIRHRGIVDVFNTGKLADGRPYLVMELLVGQPLDALIEQRGRIPLAEAFGWLDELLAAMSAAHVAGVVHRDLKPSNVFIVRQADDTRYLKVLDFGMAKQTLARGGSGTHPSLMVGTPQYMSPEQICGEPVTPRSDLYSVGVLAYQMLTGKLPFEAPTPFAYLMLHLESAPTPPTAHVPGLPPELQALLLQLLSKKPEDRPASAEEVRGRLRELAEAASVVARVAAPLSPPSGPRKRENRGAALASPEAMTGEDSTPIRSDPQHPVGRRRAATARASRQGSPVAGAFFRIARSAVRAWRKPGPQRWIALGAVLAVGLTIALFALRSPPRTEPTSSDLVQPLPVAGTEGAPAANAAAGADSARALSPRVLRERIRRLREALDHRSQGGPVSRQDAAILAGLKDASDSLRLARTAADRRRISRVLDGLEEKAGSGR